MSNTVIKNMISKSICDDIKKQLDEQFVKEVGVKDDQQIAGWFMGTRGENLSEVSEIILSVLKNVIEERANTFPNDPSYITPVIKSTKIYKDEMKKVKYQTDKLLEILNKYSLPTQSMRYQGHMLWDITLPSMIGYFAAMLQNQNNVTPQASPATTVLELLASNDIAEMIGFNVKKILRDTTKDRDVVTAWAHISCDGSVANIESLWAARELKYLPIGIHRALQKEYIGLCNQLFIPGTNKLFVEASSWQLLNLKQDVILSMPELICDLLNPELQGEDKDLELAKIWTTLTTSYSVNANGMHSIENLVQKNSRSKIETPCILVPSTKHYSWPKGASILGMGKGKSGVKYISPETGEINFEMIKDDGLINICVDENGRMEQDHLINVLDICRINKKPVIMVVGVMGTTEEGAVDPMDQIINLREKFRAAPLEKTIEYSIHADAAWGGYFLTCCRNPFEMEGYPQAANDHLNFNAVDIFDKNDSWFRDDVYNAMTSICKCDSVTIDPHKMGYIPYPAGSLTYRNDKIINLLTFSAPYINSGKTKGGISTRNIGECGIEGSKSGAAAASVYLSHKVIRPNKDGYGKIINQSILNSKMFYLYLNFIKDIYDKKDFNFEIVMFERYPDGKLSEQTKKHLITGDFDSLKKEGVLRQVPGDQNIVNYIFVDKGCKSEKRTKLLNNAIFEKFNLEPGVGIKSDDIFVSMTTFNIEDYGIDFMKSLGKRVYKNDDIPESIPCIRSVIMDPWTIYTNAYTPHNFLKDVFIPKLILVVNNFCKKSDSELMKIIEGK